MSFFTSLLECFVRLLRAFCVQTCPPTHSHAFTAVVSGIFSGDELCWRLSARLECCLCSLGTRANVGTGAKSLGHQQHPPGAGRSGFSQSRGESHCRAEHAKANPGPYPESPGGAVAEGSTCKTQITQQWLCGVPAHILAICRVKRDVTPCFEHQSERGHWEWGLLVRTGRWDLLGKSKAGGFVHLSQ